MSQRAGGRLWGITTFFNPSGYQTKLVNYRLFRERSRAQGLPLIAVELAFGDGEFVLEEGKDAEILVQLRSAAVLWQKERLLNVALSHLPPDCDQICMLDADVILNDDRWVENSSRLLERFAVIQPYRTAIRLPRYALPHDFPSSQIGRSIPQERRRRGTSSSGPTPVVEVIRYRLSFCAELERTRRFFRTATGYAWCMQRSVVEGIGFFDQCILGGGDREFALAVAYAPGKIPRSQVLIKNPRLRAGLKQWHAKLYDRVQGRVSFAQDNIHHLWHGSVRKRQYRDRHDILTRHDFSPREDIRIGESGCWEWATEKPGLVSAVREYFDSRREDG